MLPAPSKERVSTRLQALSLLLRPAEPGVLQLPRPGSSLGQQATPHLLCHSCLDLAENLAQCYSYSSAGAAASALHPHCSLPAQPCPGGTPVTSRPQPTTSARLAQPSTHTSSTYTYALTHAAFRNPLPFSAELTSQSSPSCPPISPPFLLRRTQKQRGTVASPCVSDVSHLQLRHPTESPLHVQACTTQDISLCH